MPLDLIKEFDEWWVDPYTSIKERSGNELIIHKFPPCKTEGIPTSDWFCTCGERVPEEVIRWAKKFVFIEKLTR